MCVRVCLCTHALVHGVSKRPPMKTRARHPGPVLTLSSFSLQKWMETQVTSTDDSDPWWAAFSGVFKDM